MMDKFCAVSPLAANFDALKTTIRSDRHDKAGVVRDTFLEVNDDVSGEDVLFSNPRIPVVHHDPAEVLTLDPCSSRSEHESMAVVEAYRVVPSTGVWVVLLVQFKLAVLG